VTSNPGSLTTTVNPPTTTATVSGLTNGTAYTFTVTSNNGAGSAMSQPSSPVTPATKPGSPTGVTATASNAAAVLSWTAPSDDGGSGITSYQVTSSPGGITATATGNPPATNATVSGLTNGTNYSFTVVAINGVGSSPPSSASNVITPAATAPIITRAPYQKVVYGTVGTNPANTSIQITMNWTETPGSSTICKNELQRSIDGAPWTNVTLPSATSTSVGDTLPSTFHHFQYQVRVTGCDGVASAWTPGQGFSYNLLQESSSQWTYSRRNWAVAVCRYCSAGYARYTTTQGATATLKLYAAYNVGLVFETGPTRGSARIYVDGVLLQTVNTHASRVGYRQLLVKTGWPAFGVHTVQIVNLASAGHPRIDLDAAAVTFGP